MLVLVKRKLTEAEIRLLFQEIKNTPFITGNTRREWASLTEVWVAEEKGILMGICASQDLGPQWSELGILYVLPAFRKSGIGKLLFEKMWEDLEQRGRSIYVVSRSPVVISWMRKKGMQMVTLASLPLEIRKHILRYALSLYRIREFVRKGLLWQKQLPFHYGLQFFNQNP